jgi:hypothetical protein
MKVLCDLNEYCFEGRLVGRAFEQILKNLFKG